MLPEVRSNSEIYGKTAPFHFYGGQVGQMRRPAGCSLWPLAFEPGMVKNTYGTDLHHHEYSEEDAVIRE